MIPKSRVAVYSDRYTYRYGKRPGGYGTWYFKGTDGKGKRFELDFVGMYSEAKEKAVEYASENDCCCLTVLT